MTDRARKALGVCVALAFSDDTWRYYGFPERPKHGSFWNRFRPQWLVRLEKRLFAEIIITNAAAQVAAGTLDTEHIAEITSFFTSDPQVAQCIGHTSGEILRDAILRYAQARVDDWPGILTERLRVDEIADKKVAAGVLVGCAQFSLVGARMIQQANKGS